jgi:hypothetical protein
MGREQRIREAAAMVTLNEGPKDARGRVLQEGDEILLAIPGPIYFRVAEIAPVLDPAAPPGLFHLHVGCMATFTVKGGERHREFVRVSTAAEAGPSPFTLLDAKATGGGGAS